MSDSQHSRSSSLVSRRSVTRAAAWSVPAVAVVAAAPAFAGSATNVAFTITGTCGIAGTLGPGFVVQAPADAAIPTGSTLSLSGTGVADIGVITATGPVTVDITGSGPTRVIALAEPLPAGATLTLRSTLSIAVAFTLTGVGALPSGYTAEGAKTTGTVTSTLVLCSAT